jgi:hypothetical protein
MWIEPEVFEPVSAALRNSGYEPFSSPGDRHGSWQWPFYRSGGGMTRFIVLAVTPLEQEDTLQVELWIGAEANQQSTRERVEALQENAENLPEVAEFLSRRVEGAVSRVNILSGSDLTGQRTAQRQVALAR